MAEYTSAEIVQLAVQRALKKMRERGAPVAERHALIALKAELSALNIEIAHNAEAKETASEE